MVFRKKIKRVCQRDVAFDEQVNHGYSCVAHSHELGALDMDRSFARSFAVFCRLVELVLELRLAGTQNLHITVCLSRGLHEAVSTAVSLSEERDELFLHVRLGYRVDYHDLVVFRGDLDGLVNEKRARGFARARRGRNDLPNTHGKPRQDITMCVVSLD